MSIYVQKTTWFSILNFKLHCVCCIITIYKTWKQRSDTESPPKLVGVLSIASLQYM